MRRALCLALGLVACSSSDNAQGPRDASSVDPPPPDASPVPPDAAQPVADAAPDAPDASSGHDAGPMPSTCRKAKTGVRVGTLDAPALSEASGIVASRSQPGVLWLHNDSGDGPRLFAHDATGKALCQVMVTGADANDWEDIAIGKGPEAGKSYLYIGDIGDNEEKRKRIQIYRIEEPMLDANGNPPSAEVAAHRLDVTYDDDAHDVETLLSDPISGNLYTVGKAGVFEVGAQVPVHRIAFADLDGDTAVAVRVAMVPLGAATGGDVLPDGSAIAVRNYTSVRYWERKPGESVEEAMMRSACLMPISEGLGAQGEALGFTADGKAYLTTTEGEGSGLFRYDFE